MYTVAVRYRINLILNKKIDTPVQTHEKLNIMRTVWKKEKPLEREITNLNGVS